eukprot:scaffold176339_cov20-Cyclotella_meneghiniana.AAC.1
MSALVMDELEKIALRNLNHRTLFDLDYAPKILLMNETIFFETQIPQSLLTATGEVGVTSKVIGWTG